MILSEYAVPNVPCCQSDARIPSMRTVGLYEDRTAKTPNEAAVPLTCPAQLTKDMEMNRPKLEMTTEKC